MILLDLHMQLPLEPPTSFTALQWVVVITLASALVYVFRLWQVERKNCKAEYLATIDRLIRAIEDEAVK